MARTFEMTHKIMSAVKSKNTKPELLLRHALWARGMRYRVNVKYLLGKPDIVFTKAKIVVFCDGDFWHGNNWKLRGLNSFEKELSCYSDFWVKKLTGNVIRDKKNTRLLKKQGWSVLRFWESDILSKTEACVEKIMKLYLRKTSLILIKN